MMLNKSYLKWIIGGSVITGLTVACVAVFLVLQPNASIYGGSTVEASEMSFITPVINEFSTNIDSKSIELRFTLYNPHTSLAFDGALVSLKCTTLEGKPAEFRILLGAADDLPRRVEKHREKLGAESVTAAVPIQTLAPREERKIQLSIPLDTHGAIASCVRPQIQGGW